MTAAPAVAQGRQAIMHVCGGPHKLRKLQRHILWGSTIHHSKSVTSSNLVSISCNASMNSKWDRLHPVLALNIGILLQTYCQYDYNSNNKHHHHHQHYTEIECLTHDCMFSITGLEVILAETCWKLFCVSPQQVNQTTKLGITNSVLHLFEIVHLQCMLQYGMLFLALIMPNWYANSCLAMTLHIQASLDLPAWGIFKL